MNKMYLYFVVTFLEISAQFKAVLENIAFIQIGQHAYKPSQLCDRENPLFLAGYPNLILPDEFYNKEDNWLPFLKLLNLRVSPDAKEILDLANIFAQKFQNGSIDTPKLDELAKRIVKELSNEKASILNRPIFEKIKKVKFIPSYFCTSSPSIHLKVFNPIATKQSANCCIHDSYFKEHLDLVWIKNAILPDYCRAVSVLLQIPPSCSLVVDNFIEILKRCSNEQFIKQLNQTEKHALEAIFMKYYEYLEAALVDHSNDNRKEISRLKDLNCVWNVRKDGEIHLDKARCFYKAISQEESVPPYILKMPSFSHKYSELLNALGSGTSVTFEACAEALEGLAATALNLPATNHFDSILSIYKFFFYDDILCETSPPIKFYAPNSAGVLHKLEDLYYDMDGPEKLAYIFKQANATRCTLAPQLNLMFDIESLRTKYPMGTTCRVSNQQNDTSLKRTAVFKEMNSWAKIFRTFPYFIKNPKLAPRPLSDLIERRILGEKDANFETDDVMNSIFK